MACQHDVAEIPHTIAERNRAALRYPNRYIIGIDGLDAIIVVIYPEVGSKAAEQALLLKCSHILFLPLGREREGAGDGLNALGKKLLMARFATQCVPEVGLIIVALDMG